MLKSFRTAYWAGAEHCRNWFSALTATDGCFRRVALQEYFGPRAAISPVTEETERCAAAAVDWLLRAQDATADDGVSYGYFPAARERGWQASYPETTGYIITSLLTYARGTERADLVERARRMAHWEVTIQMPSGAVQGGKVTSPEEQRAAAFNTGMVLDGFVSLLEQRPDDSIATAAERAAAFLCRDLNEAGLFTTNGPFVSGEKVKIYNVLCAWALYRYGLLSGDARSRSAAVRAAEGALKFQAANGWFAENCLTMPSAPLTHTIGYTLQGLMEVGALAEREDILKAVERGFNPLIAAMEPNGFLAGRFAADWCPAVSWSCLSGSAQVAIVGYRLSDLVGQERYAWAANRLVDFLKSLQRRGVASEGLDGALAGSYPIFGGYMTGGYPNWATKYFLDALMLQAERAGISLHPRQGEPHTVDSGAANVDCELDERRVPG